MKAMKKMMILVSAIMMVAAGYAKKNVETKPFEGVNVNVPACIRFVNGDRYEMNVRSTDSLAADNIMWSVEDGVLKIRSRHAVEGSTEAPTVCITITTPSATEPTLTVARNLLVKESKGLTDMASVK